MSLLNAWSSSEFSGSNAHNLNTNNGDAGNNDKNNNNPVVAFAPAFYYKENAILKINICNMEKLYKYVSYEELLLAYYDCRKHKRNTKEAIEFELNRYKNLYKLLKELNNGTYTIGVSKCFIVTKPVIREVFAASFRDRIVHHLIINRINIIFENEVMIDKAFACRKGKGTLYGIKQLVLDIKTVSQNYKKETFVFKGDFKSFFMSIDKRLLFDLIKKCLNDIYEKYGWNENDLEFNVTLLKKIIFHCPQKNCIRRSTMKLWEKLPKSKSLFNCDDYHGLPIGNLSSQISANFFLSYFDNYVIKTLGFIEYGRYVDDFYIVSDNKEKILKSIPKIKNYLKKMGVTLHPNKIYLQEHKKGVQFIGGVIKPNRVYILNRTKGNCIQKIKKINKILETEQLKHNEINEIISSVNSYLGLFKHYNTFKLRKKIIINKLSRNIFRYCAVTVTYQKIVKCKPEVFTPQVFYFCVLLYLYLLHISNKSSQILINPPSLKSSKDFFIVITSFSNSLNIGIKASELGNIGFKSPILNFFPLSPIIHSANLSSKS